VAGESPHSDDSIISAELIVSENSTISDAFSLGCKLDCIAISCRISIVLLVPLGVTNNNILLSFGALAEALEIIINHRTICCPFMAPSNSVNSSIHLTFFGIVILIETVKDTLGISRTSWIISCPERACLLPNWDGWFIGNATIARVSARNAKVL